MRLSVCGIDCEACKYRTEMNCGGCTAKECKVFWGKCELHQCCTEKGHEHCGQCEEFPCAKLQEWASQENPERIDNLRTLIN